MTKLFGVLLKEMKRKGVTQEDLAKTLGITQAAVSYKLTGGGDFKSEEMIKIQDQLFPDVDLRTLFTKI